jgi:enamine deaminase RidA (YjgF/YER057c/UK114 family)
MAMGKAYACTVGGMNRELRPAALPAPAAAYAHGVLVENATRWLHTCGVVAKAADGSVPTSVQGQLDVIWENIGIILAEGGMGISDIVSMTTYLCESPTEEANHGPVNERLAVVMKKRDEVLGGHKPASTLLTVPVLARPEWRVEISVIAAQ